MVTLAEVLKHARRHSTIGDDTLHNVMVCVKMPDGTVVYAEAVDVRPHPGTGEVAVILDVKG